LPCTGKWPHEPALDHSLKLRWVLLLLWMAGPFLWVAYWAWYFYSYCEFGVSFTCVMPGTLEAVFYSIPDVLKLMLGAPVLALVVWLVLNWAWRTYARHEPKS
jgi:hypothetical protein